MSGRFRVTPRAYKDLVGIARYTLKTWGASQRDAYLADLERRFQWLADHPKRGRPRDDVAPGYRSFPQGSHVVFYVIVKDGVDIIGVPHKAMDVDGYFERE